MASRKSADSTLRVGTRGSKLALWQAGRVVAGLRATRPDLRTEIVTIESAGDRHGEAPIADLGIVGIFTREIEHALLDDRIDVGVHSLKDLPTTTPAGLEIAACLRRDESRDALVAPVLSDAHPRTGADALAALPAEARIATSSLRRQAEILRHRPDCRVVELRGNVPTRLAKVYAGDVDGVVLSEAGLQRLGFDPPGHVVLEPETMLPAPGQGTIAVEVRSDDAETRAHIASLDDADTRLCTTAERAVLAHLRGGCRVPLGVMARIARGELMILHARVSSPDGRTMVEERVMGPPRDATALARALADALRARGADAILAALERL
jgi:hydroxymethylbilane synthase